MNAWYTLAFLQCDLWREKAAVFLVLSTWHEQCQKHCFCASCFFAWNFSSSKRLHQLARSSRILSTGMANSCSAGAPPANHFHSVWTGLKASLKAERTSSVSLPFPDVCDLQSYWPTLGSLGVMWNDRCLCQVCPAVFLRSCLFSCLRTEAVQMQGIIFRRTTSTCESWGSEKSIPWRKILLWIGGTRNSKRQRYDPVCAHTLLQSLYCVSEYAFTTVTFEVYKGEVSNPSWGNSKCRQLSQTHE